jgi:hypothetical protein
MLFAGREKKFGWDGARDVDSKLGMGKMMAVVEEQQQQQQQQEVVVVVVWSLFHIHKFFFFFFPLLTTAQRFQNKDQMFLRATYITASVRRGAAEARYSGHSRCSRTHEATPRAQQPRYSLLLPTGACGCPPTCSALCPALPCPALLLLPPPTSSRRRRRRGTLFCIRAWPQRRYSRMHPGTLRPEYQRPAYRRACPSPTQRAARCGRYLSRLPNEIAVSRKNPTIWKSESTVAYMLSGAGAGS